MKKNLFFVLLLVSSFVTKAQLFEDEQYEYNKEWIWGISKHSNGGLIGGVIIRFSRSRGEHVYETYGIEFANVKHPSESRYTGLSGQAFTYGKTNYLYAIRLRYGRSKLFFEKAYQQGVQINGNIAGGPTLGLASPYYVLLNSNEYQQFDPVYSPESIAGPGRIFQGLGESKLVPGINVKISVSFDFGAYRSNVIGTEVGVLTEVYTSKIEIVPTKPNRSVYNSIFLAIFWGSRK